MKTNPSSLVLIGAGHTHALVMLGIKHLLPKHVQLTVVDPKPKAVYSGMLPGFIAGHYRREDLDINIEQLSRTEGAKFVQAAATAIDPKKKRVVLSNGETISYEVASIDVGITSNMPNLRGFEEYAVPAKPLAKFSTAWDEFCQSDSADKINVPKITVIGGGVAGAELAMAMAHRLGQQAKACQITLVDRSTVLGDVLPNTGRQILRAFQRFNIEIIENAEVVSLNENGVVLSDEKQIDADLVVGAAGASPQPWLTHTNLKLQDGYLNVNSYLQTSDPDIFAVGDCAHFAMAPLPKAGVYAVRQAPILRDNLIAQLTDKELREYRPQSDFLKLISLGGKTAIAQKFGWSLSGRWAWALKNWIDRGFMNRFKG